MTVRRSLAAGLLARCDGADERSPGCVGEEMVPAEHGRWSLQLRCARLRFGKIGVMYEVEWLNVWLEHTRELLGSWQARYAI